VEADFLADGDGQACCRAGERVTQYRDLLVSPHATAQLQREIVESASADESVAKIDRNSPVHMLLSITTERNLGSDFAGDVPTEAEIAKLERETPKMNLDEMRPRPAPAEAFKIATGVELLDVMRLAVESSSAAATTVRFASPAMS
jgi:hypothetical protein